MSSAQRKLISIITVAYNEEDCLLELGQRLIKLFDRQKNYDFEVILVENSSSDRTFEYAQVLRKQDQRFKILQMSRNFGMDGGVTAGLDYASGDAVVIMAADLQDPVEVIDDLILEWENGYENVYGLVKKRKGTSLLRRMNSCLFYWIIQKLSGGLIPRNVSDFRLLDRRLYETLRELKEKNRFIRGLIAWCGFKSMGVQFERPERFGGKSHANTLRVLNLALKGIFAHSYFPLRVCSVSGLILSGILVIIAFLVILMALYHGEAGGWILSFVMLLGAFWIAGMSSMAEYLALIYEEVKQRPNFIVSKSEGLDVRKEDK
jgi:dolichol-phosphate mannosyltransferase